MLLADALDGAKKRIAATCRCQQRQTAIATEGDEVEMSAVVEALEVLGHGGMEVYNENQDRIAIFPFTHSSRKKSKTAR